MPRGYNVLRLREWIFPIALLVAIFDNPNFEAIENNNAYIISSKYEFIFDYEQQSLAFSVILKSDFHC